MDFFPKNDQIWPIIGIFGHFGPGLACSFGALLVGWLVVVARAVSCKTPIYCIDNTDSKDNHNDNSDDVDNVNDSNDRYYYDQ